MAWAFRRDHSRSIFAGMVLAAVATVSIAHGDSAELELDFSGPKDCGSKAEILRLLAQSLGPESDTSGWSARISISGEPPEHLSLAFSARHVGVDSRRELAVDSCRAVDEASALLLLLAIDPLRAAEVVAASPELGRVAESATDTPIEEPPPVAAAIPGHPEPRVKPQTRVKSRAARPPSEKDAKPEKGPSSHPSPLVPSRAWVGGAGLWHSGETAGAGLGLAAQVGGAWNWFALALGGSWLAETEAPIARAEGASVAIWGLGAQLQAMFRFRSGYFEGAPFLGAGVRYVESVALRISDPGPRRATAWGTLLGGLQLSFQPANHIAFFGSVAGVVPLDPPRFRVGGLDVVHQPGAALEVLVGFSWTWGSQ